MTWRGSTDVKDKIFASLVYALPLIDGLRFSEFLFSQIPLLKIIYVPLIPLIAIYQSFPWASLIIFFLLFLLVVRNERISHFIRYNTMQAILIDILLTLCGFVLIFFLQALGNNLLTETLFNVVFLGTLAASIYSIVQSAMGKYAEIPTISQAVYSQVP